MEDQEKDRVSYQEKGGIYKKNELPFHISQDTSLLAHFSCTVSHCNVFDHDPACICVLPVQDYARSLINFL